MGAGTELGKVRGLGSARAGSHHWWLQRVTAAGNILLIVWLIVSLLRLPALDHGALVRWLESPLAAVPLALTIVNLAWHFRLGLQVVIEDYVHGGSRLIALAALHLWTFGAAGVALFALLKIAFTGAAD